MDKSLYPESAKDAVERWDAGETVWTLEMGGLGPGYEQAIQTFMIEILREAVMRGKPAAEYTNDNWRAMADAVLHTMDKELGGLSGAQYGGACWLAYQLYSKGWEAVRAEAKKQGDGDRWIQVSTHWPKAA